MKRLATLISALVLAGSAPASGGDYSWPSDAPYSVSKAKMDRALECKRGRRVSEHGAQALNGSGRKHPVLLVHGTGVSRRQNWEWNYWGTLPEKGWEVCWVALPNSALRDIQVSSEYVARAITVMHKATGERIDILAHSQGGLQPRWAIKWFKSARFVADYIALATPNHGTAVAEKASMDEGCFPSCWQMRRDSKFIGALNRDVETPGPIHYTSIYTTFDELVQPTGTQKIKGASNIHLQDLCPGRPVDHVGIARDYVTWLLVRHALRTPGPADPGIIGSEDCTGTTMPGSEEPPAGAADLQDFTSQGRITDHEPPLKRYAR